MIARMAKNQRENSARLLGRLTLSVSSRQGTSWLFCTTLFTTHAVTRSSPCCSPRVNDDTNNANQVKPPITECPCLPKSDNDSRPPSVAPSESISAALISMPQNPAIAHGCKEMAAVASCDRIYPSPPKIIFSERLTILRVLLLLVASTSLHTFLWREVTLLTAHCSLLPTLNKSSPGGFHKSAYFFWRDATLLTAPQSE
jgi:hypothetical protein